MKKTSINKSVKSQKQYVHPTILLQWQKECLKRYQHQFIVVLNNWTFRSHYWGKFCIKALVWRHTKFNWFRSWNQKTIQCVFASLCRNVIDLQKMSISAKKKSSFQMNLILFLADTSKIVSFGAQNTCTHTMINRRTQNESLFGAINLIVTVNYFLRCGIKVECYANKSETINSLKDNIRLAIAHNR